MALRLFNGVLVAGILTVAVLIVVARAGSVDFAARTRPMSQAYVVSLMSVKRSAAEAAGSPKLVIVAGSGAMYGLRCEVLSRRLKLPCVNAGLPIDLGAKAILDFGKTLLRPGDTALLPFEYSFYFVPAYGGGSISLPRLFRVNFDYAVNSVAENWLISPDEAAKQFLSVVTPLGDRKGHTAASARSSEDFRRREHLTLDVHRPIGETFKHQLEAFLDWARENDVRVIGALQPIYEDLRVPEPTIDAIASIYRRHGFSFVGQQEQFRYRREDFYDSYDHLDEEMQTVHSERMASLLAAQPR